LQDRHCNAELTFITSFVDRDMLMRYHWGLAVGHVYTHQRKSDAAVGESRRNDMSPRSNNAHSPDEDNGSPGDHESHMSGGSHPGTEVPNIWTELEYEDDEQEYELDESDDDSCDWDEESGDEDSSDCSDEQAALDLDEMYGTFDIHDEDD
jgi:hypothetical protein